MPDHSTPRRLSCTPYAAGLISYRNPNNIGVRSGSAGLALAPLNETDLLIKFTYDGDANIDGRINADDYFLIDSAFLGQGAPLTGRVDSSPLLSVTVPEPTSTILLLALSAVLRRRRPNLPRA